MENETDDYLEEMTPEQRAEEQRGQRRADAADAAAREEENAELLYEPEVISERKQKAEEESAKFNSQLAEHRRAEKDDAARQSAGLHSIALSQALPAHQRERESWERRWNNATPEQIPGLRAEGEELAARERQIRESLEVVNRTTAKQHLSEAFPWLNEPATKEAFLEWAEERYDVTREEAMAITDPQAIYAAGKRFERHMEKQEQARQAAASERAQKTAAAAAAKKAWNGLSSMERRFVKASEDGQLDALILYDGPHKDFVKKHGAKVPHGRATPTKLTRKGTAIGFRDNLSRKSKLGAA